MVFEWEHEVENACLEVAYCAWESRGGGVCALGKPFHNSRNAEALFRSE